jgi:hypothetical protein
VFSALAGVMNRSVFGRYVGITQYGKEGSAYRRCRSRESTGSPAPRNCSPQRPRWARATSVHLVGLRPRQVDHLLPRVHVHCS